MKKIKLFILLFYSSFLFSQNKEYKRFYYPSGQLSSEGIMNNNKPDGLWKSYYPNGILKSEGKRINSILDSTWTFFSETADTLEKVNYFNGKKSGYHLIYKTVQNKNEGKKSIVISKELFINDLKEGPLYNYFLSGKIQNVSYYSQGKIVGESKEYNESGDIITLYQYKNGELQNIEKINRTDNNGKKIGIWREYYLNEKLKKEIYYKNNLPQGIQKEYDPLGKLISSINYIEGNIDLNYNNDQDSIDIKEELYENGTIKKSGAYRNTTPIGVHKLYNKNGELYYAFIYNNFGVVTSEGYLNKIGKREGKWIEYFSENSIKAEGDYRGNKKNGYWKFYFLSGKIEQKGSFENDLFDGKWIWYNNDEKIIKQEDFILGIQNGEFIEKDSDGDTITIGQYLDGKKTGLWLEKEGNILFKGNYQIGLKIGTWKGIFENNNVYFIGNFLQGNPDDKHTYYQDNGNLYEMQYYSNGIKIGNWTKYNEDGTVKFIITYRKNIEFMINGFKIEKIGK